MEDDLTFNSKPLKSYGLRTQYFFISRFFQSLFATAFGIFWTFLTFNLKAPFFIPIFGLVFIVLAIGLFLAPSKYYRLMKNGKRIKKGMHIDQVREILKPFHIEKSGYNRDKEYCVYFKEKAIFGKDYEGVLVSFYENKVVGIDFSYHRTTTTTYYN